MVLGRYLIVGYLDAWGCRVMYPYRAPSIDNTYFGAQSMQIGPNWDYLEAQGMRLRLFYNFLKP